jgi:Rieske Fe-S protein
MVDLAYANLSHAPPGETRRDFATLTAGVWPCIDTIKPARDTLATEVDLEPVAVAQRPTVGWRGKPEFIDRRISAEITAPEAAEIPQLCDSQPASDRPGWVPVPLNLGFPPYDLTGNTSIKIG